MNFSLMLPDNAGIENVASKYVQEYVSADVSSQHHINCS